MKTVAAHFDGKEIVLEEPVELTAHTKLKVIVPEEGETFSDEEREMDCGAVADGELDFMTDKSAK